MPKDAAGGRRLVVGLMSGTSMDGVDAALVQIRGKGDYIHVRLLDFFRARFPGPLRRKLLEIAAGSTTSTGEISQLNFLLGEIFADAALGACRGARIAPRRLAVIDSHGQTIYHQGKPSYIGARPIASTLQIAEAAVIAERTGAPVVSDFRTADMAAGGQGAPLVPMVDYLLLRLKREGVVALNLGGIANVTVIPAGARPADVFGFDTGPGNMVVDGLVRYFTKGRKGYDAGGRWAARGELLEPLLTRALAFPYFRREPPKSAGREQFGSWFVKHYFLEKRNARPEDLLRTATELTARSVRDALERFVFPKVKIRRLIVSGGGAHNRFLIRRLREILPELRLNLSDDYGLPADAKEAIAFAVLADRSLHGHAGNLPTVTGARRSVVLGKITRP
ncbi:MAG TPA: anhydro-N-acetylmuramic acid kinase [Gemmataceae bacterium]|nr:anhydro-N-acetylmuramic acid kinase [Gemmataceae bacterium]